MAKPRRNDPCPCGSGKKYKNCCMRQDRVSESRELHLVPDEAILLNSLYEYAQSQRFLSDVMQAFDVFWGGSFALGGGEQLDTDDMRRLMEWFAHDYHTAQDRKRVIDLFVENKTTEYPPEALELLEAWSNASVAMYRVLDTSDANTLNAFDCLREQELRIYDPMLTRNARPGEILVGRHFQVGDMHRLTLTTMILPPDYEPGLVDYVRNAYEIYVDQHYQATWDEFLRENGHIFNAYLVSDKAAALRSLIGPGTRYHDPAITRDKLQEIASRRLSEQRQAQQQEREPRQPVHRTTSGIILPGTAAEEPGDKEQEPSGGSRILIPGRDS